MPRSPVYVSWREANNKNVTGERLCLRLQQFAWLEIGTESRLIQVRLFESAALSRMSLHNLRLLIVFLLLFSLPGCRSAATERSQTLLNEANQFLDQDLKVMNQWSREFGHTFSEQNRAKFPTNREWLTDQAEKVMPLVDESLRLTNEAAAKYEEAGRLMSKAQDRRAINLIASSFKIEGEMKQLFKAQAQLASDHTINDAKTFNEKFNSLTRLIQEKQKQKDQQFDEGKRLLLGR